MSGIKDYITHARISVHISADLRAKGLSGSSILTNYAICARVRADLYGVPSEVLWKGGRRREGKGVDV